MSRMTLKDSCACMLNTKSLSLQAASCPPRIYQIFWDDPTLHRKKIYSSPKLMENLSEIYASLSNPEFSVRCWMAGSIRCIAARKSQLNSPPAVRKSGIASAQVSVLETNASAKGFLKHFAFKFIRYFFEIRLDMGSARLPSVRQGPITSRKLKSGEEELLTQIQNRCFADTWGFNPNTTAEIAYRLNMHGRSPEDVTLTYMDNKPVGYCWIIMNPEGKTKREKRKGLIHMLGVDPDSRQQEIGKAVLLGGLEDLKARGVDIVDLTVDSENPAACALYESVGIEVVAKTEWYEKTVL